MKNIIALSESSPQLPDSASLRDIDRATEAARIAGWHVYYIPQDLPDEVSAEDALWHIPPQEGFVHGIWIGYIPLPSHYEEIYKAAYKKNICLLNTPEEFRRAEEFDRFYPLIADLTAESECVGNVEDCESAAQRIGYPVFLKGTVQSFKSKGIEACVAHGPEDVRRIAKTILGSQRRSLGKVIVRRWLDMRHCRSGPGGFPLGREYRVFVYNGTTIGLGYYWEDDDELTSLSGEEREIITELAIKVSHRLKVPYLAVDIGQTTRGEWTVIEVGDAQFSGVSQTPIHQLWSRLTVSVRSSAKEISHN